MALELWRLVVHITPGFKMISWFISNTYDGQLLALGLALGKLEKSNHTETCGFVCCKESTTSGSLCHYSINCHPLLHHFGPLLAAPTVFAAEARRYLHAGRRLRWALVLCWQWNVCNSCASNVFQWNCPEWSSWLCSFVSFRKGTSKRISRIL